MGLGVAVYLYYPKKAFSAQQNPTEISVPAVQKQILQNQTAVDVLS